MICDLNRSLGSRQFLNVVNERTCFTSCAYAFKCSRLFTLVLNALLTKILPMFSSGLNEINGGCEKILPVSESF